MSEDHSFALGPVAVMRDHGFEEYAEEAAEVLPADWGERYQHSPKVLAYGLTYYVAYQDLTQRDVAEAYDVTGVTVRSSFSTLRDDLGPPQ